MNLTLGQKLLKLVINAAEAAAIAIAAHLAVKATEKMEEKLSKKK